MIMQKCYFTLFTGMVLAVSLMGFGCNPLAKVEEKVSEKIGEKVAEGMMEKAIGGKVDVDAENNQVVFKDNKTGSMTAFGEDLKIPDNFPKDVPIYSGAKATGVIMDNEGDKTASLSLQSADDPEKVLSWYEKTLKNAGWEETESWSANDAQARSYDKDKSHLTLTVSKGSEDEKDTVIMLVKTVDQEEEKETEE